MASGDVVFSRTNMQLTESSEVANAPNGSQWAWLVALRFGSGYTLETVNLSIGHYNPTASLFDITKTYDIEIKEH